MKQIIILTILFVLCISSCSTQKFLNAAKEGDIEIIETLLHVEDVNINLKGSRGITALMQTAINNQFKAAAFLLANGAEIDMQNINGSTALMMAVYYGHEEIAQLLVAQGADVNLRSKYGDTALKYAIYYNRKEITQLLIDVGAVE